MLIAHRGFRNEYGGENRMIDFTLALNVTPAVEFDIRLTKDKKVIIFHDDDFKRIGNSKMKVSELKYQEIKELPFFQANPESIPPLLIDDFSEELAKRYKLINVEIKVEEYDEWDLNLIKTALMILRQATKAEIIVSSFGLDLLKWISEFNQDFKKGYLIKKIENLDLNLVKKFDYLHPSIRIAKNEKHHKLIEEINLPLNVWTFKKDQDFKKVEKIKPLIKGYISDIPNLAIASYN